MRVNEDCQCTLHQRTVGDGCSVCNPPSVEDLLDENSMLRQEVDSLVNFLLKVGWSYEQIDNIIDGVSPYETR